MLILFEFELDRLIYEAQKRFKANFTAFYKVLEITASLFITRLSLIRRQQIGQRKPKATFPFEREYKLKKESKTVCS